MVDGSFTSHRSLQSAMSDDERTRIQATNRNTLTEITRSHAR
jgi:hypothetical protein